MLATIAVARRVQCAPGLAPRWCSVSVGNVVPGRRARKQAESIYTDGTLDGMRQLLLQDVGDEMHAAVVDSDLSADDEFEWDDSSDDESDDDSSTGSVAHSDEQEGSDSHLDSDTESDSDYSEAESSQGSEASEISAGDASSSEPDFEDSDSEGSEGSEDAETDDDPMDVEAAPEIAARASDETAESLFGWFGGLEVRSDEWDEFTGQLAADRWRTRPDERTDAGFFLSWSAQRRGE